MKIIATILIVLCVKALSAQPTQSPKILSNPVPPISDYSNEIVSQLKMAKEYYMTSTDTAAGKTYEERVARLSNKIIQLFQRFRTTRINQYRSSTYQFDGSDWATNKITPKTENIAKNTYTFTSISRTRSGDWKAGPIINGIDRNTWTHGDIEGGPVSWSTGGQGKSQTFWKISAKYKDNFIDATVVEEIKSIKLKLNSLELPTEIAAIN